MREWLEGLAGPEYAMALLWTLLALFLLVVVLVVVKLVRNLTFGTFVAGGRNRKTRLAVMDATAVDSHRRLVLVRRDDVEHLLLIGGPTDVVVEQDIRLQFQQRRPAQHTEHDLPPRQPERSRPTEVPQTAPQRNEAPPRHPQAQPVPPQQRAPERHAPQLVSPHPGRPPNNSVPETRPPAPARAPAAVNTGGQTHYLGSRATPVAAKPQPVEVDDDIDDALMEELEVSLDNGSARKPAKPELSLEDEMTKLLGELSSHKR
ncbi:flagellar biosynthetic protein FliO [Mesorhizobium sp. ZC-5]|uniref:flagellar biosynthetic protein FliO n=1 Tax=Mesorhizobium sp. ZC-5 TaxID=2986066 RepID=UPI0021E97D63|nr:flagellar biosynthetic protein FliO [Mesorhizobium sp. ZC-5]MCV3241423.1 flagellar biosynthetic protein FliO [Mesorhizobium sp. ZC-5]